MKILLKRLIAIPLILALALTWLPAPVWAASDTIPTEATGDALPEAPPDTTPDASKEATAELESESAPIGQVTPISGGPGTHDTIPGAPTLTPTPTPETQNAADDEVYAILYGDGTLVFQYGDAPDTSHGTVTATYAIDLAGYSYDSAVPWYNNRESITAIDFADSISPVSTAWWFDSFENLTQISSLDRLDTSNITNMRNMFCSCQSLTALDVSDFDTSSVTDMYMMFYGCSNLTEFDISSFNTSNVTNIAYMFEGCSSLTALDISSFDTSNVTNMTGMFENCTALTTVYTSDKFVTDNVTSSNVMFNNCTSLVGGNGTRNDVKHLDKEYARIDSESAPGYFTLKGDAPTNTPTSMPTSTPKLIKIVT